MQALPTELDRLIYWGVCKQSDDYDERTFLESLDAAAERGTVTTQQAAALRAMLGIERHRGLN